MEKERIERTFEADTNAILFDLCANFVKIVGSPEATHNCDDFTWVKLRTLPPKSELCSIHLRKILRFFTADLSYILSATIHVRRNQSLQQFVA